MDDLTSHPIYREPQAATPENTGESCTDDAAIPYAEFHLNGSTDLVVGRDLNRSSLVVKITSGGAFGGPVKKLYLPMNKSLARAIASAIMGAAAEL